MEETKESYPKIAKFISLFRSNVDLVFVALFVFQAIILFVIFLFNGSENMAIGAAYSLIASIFIGSPALSYAIAKWVTTPVDRNTAENAP